MPKILIAEDDLMIADMIEEVLVEHGYQVCGIGRTVAEAVALGLHHRPDLAIIDVKLAGGGIGTEVAARLSGLTGLGILYVGGNATAATLTTAHGHACLMKPYHFADLMRGLEIVAELVATGTAKPPFPTCIQLLTAVMASSPKEFVDAR